MPFPRLTKYASVIAAVIFLCLSDVCEAALPSWFSRPWQADDGLPGNNVTGLAQTKDGYLWIATQNGLARFDGVRIQKILIPAGRARPIIWAMLLDREQRQWLAEEGGWLVTIQGEKATILGATNGIPTALPASLVQTADGAVWISYVDGSVCSVVGEKVDQVEALPGTGLCYLATDSGGQLWGARGGRVGIFQDRKFATAFTLDARTIQLRAATDGGIWICADGQILKCRSNAAPVPVGRLSGDSSTIRPTVLLEDHTGALWIGTSANGVFRFDGTNAVRIETTHGRIRTLIEDREGNIWVGTDGGGLNRLRQRVVELQGKEAGLPFETVRSVCEDAGGNLWVVTQDGELARTENGVWRTISNTNEWKGGQATCITSDKKGTIWIGTYSRGLYHWSDGKFSAIRRRDGLAGSNIRALLAASSGDLWIGLSSGSMVQRLRDGNFQNFPQPSGSRAVRAMAEDASGNIWMGTLDRQLLRVSGDKLVDETSLTGSNIRAIRSLTATPDGSLWIGYAGSGVGRLNAGGFGRVGVKQGLADGDICSVMPDTFGRIWFASDHGIFYVDQSQLEKVSERLTSRVECIAYGQDDGLPSLQGYYGYSPGAVRCRDGRILLPTHSGLAIVNPQFVQTNRIPPRVVVESVAVDNQMIHGSAPGGLNLPAAHRKLEITFTAPSFIAPEKVRYRYYLKGWDEDWIDAADPHRAGYSRLPDGSYEFQVAACNNAGIWSESAAIIRFVVAPFWWNTWWFRIGVIFFFTAAVAGIVRYISFRRLRAALRRLEQETALQRERARIAEDIHDDLGARLTQISLLGELSQRKPQQATENAGQIATMARQGMKSLDEIVWAVNPRNDTLSHLLDYVGQYAINFLHPAGIRCRVDFPAQPPALALSAEARHSVFLSVKEALNNIVKHSGAHEVCLRAAITNGTLQMRIEDNGRGFDGQSPASGSAAAVEDSLRDGLRNMRERLSRIGGSCVVDSKSGAGVKILLEAPVRRDKDALKL